MLTKKQLLKTLAIFKHTGKKGHSLLDYAKEYLLEDPLLLEHDPLLVVKNGRIYGSCKCSYNKTSGKICEHIIAKIIYLHRELLEDEPDWQEFIEKYKEVLKKAVDKIEARVPEDFANF